MDFQEQIRECKAQALTITNDLDHWGDHGMLAEDIIDMLPVQVYSDEEAQEQFEA